MRYANQLSEAYREMSQEDVFRDCDANIKIYSFSFCRDSYPVHWRPCHMENILTHIVLPFGMWYRFALAFGDTL